MRRDEKFTNRALKIRLKNAMMVMLRMKRLSERGIL